MRNLHLTGGGKYGQAKVKVNVPVMLFQEESTWYAYLPSFDLTGYGTDEEEAKESLKVMLDEFIRYTLNKNTFVAELERLGWQIKDRKRKFIAPKINDLMKENEELREIID